VEPLPAPGRSMAKKALAGMLAIVLMSAGAVSAYGLLTLNELKDIFQAANGRQFIKTHEITPAEAGKPQTIMILGTDGRIGVEGDAAAAGTEGRSDTIILARLNATKSAITLMSIPRDLRVPIPGYSSGSKINAAYSAGGSDLTLKTVKALLSTPEAPFKINHVIQVSFEGFRKMVDYLGCAYVDIDQHYFNDHGGIGGYAVIDIPEGYQKLCGMDALSYVRYRHTDNDLIRGARQQDFIRQLLRQPGVRKRLSFSKRKVLAKIAGTYTHTDESLDSTTQILSLLKLGLGVAEKPIQQVPFGAGQVSDSGTDLIVSSEGLAETVNEFMNPETITDTTAKVESKPKPPKKPKHKKGKTGRKAATPTPTPVPGLPSGMTSIESLGQSQSIAVHSQMRFPLYFPALGDYRSRFVSSMPRVYGIKDELGNYHQAYRMVISLGIAGQYYGVQGMTWTDPPILDGPHDTLYRDGKQLEVFYDGKKVRLVAFRTKKAVYYVENTLTRDLPYKEIVAIAASLTKLG
jgi:LCP family protein required for cell wall assembly